MNSLEIRQSLEMSERNLSFGRSDSGAEIITIQQRFNWKIYDFAKITRPPPLFEYKSPSFPVTLSVNTLPNAELLYSENGNWISLFVHFPSLNMHDLSKINATITLGLLDAKDDVALWSVKVLQIGVKTLIPDKSCTWGFPEFAWRYKTKPNIISRDKTGEPYLNWEVHPLVFFCNMTAVINDTQLQQPILRSLPVLNDLSKLYQSGLLTDVDFIVDDTKLHAHKVILAARSEVFRAMFQTDMQEATRNVVDITDYDHVTFDSFLQFVYSGKAENLEKNADDLLQLANKYAMADLVEICERHLIDNLTVENASRMLVKADLHGANVLREATVTFIKRHLNEVKATDGWKLARVENPQIIIDLWCE